MFACHVYVYVDRWRALSRSFNSVEKKVSNSNNLEAESFEAYEAVAKVLQAYIDGAKSGDGNHCRPAFFDHAHIVGSVNGEHSNLNADQFKDAVNSIGPSPDIKHRIVWIDISGPAAAAKIEFINWAGFRFTDFFVLFRNEGQWKISGKVYDTHSKN